MKLKTQNDKIIRISAGDTEGVFVRVYDKGGICPNEQRRTTGDSQRDNRLLSNFNDGVQTLHTDLRLHDTVRVTVRTDTGRILILEVLPQVRPQSESTKRKGVFCADDKVRESLGLILRYRDELKISVKISTDKNITLAVPPFQTVKYVKKMIHDKECIPMDIQRLIFARNALYDQLSLNELGIADGSQLVLSRITQHDMDIFVWTMTGKVYKLTVKPCDTIDTLKSKIQCISGFPPHQQRLVFAGNNLADTRFVGDYGIQTESTLQLFIHPQDDIQVLIKMLTGQKLTLKMLPSDTVADMKGMITKETGYPNDMMFLVSMKRRLPDEEILHAIGIGNNSTVHVIFPLGGDPYNEFRGYLMNEKTLTDYNIHKEHILNLIIGFKSCSVQIDTTVNEMVMSKRHFYQSDENIRTIKSRILDNEGMILPKQRHKTILDGVRRKGSDFDMTKEHSIHLVLRLCEGMQIRIKTNIDGPVKLEHSNWKSIVLTLLHRPMGYMVIMNTVKSLI